MDNFDLKKYLAEGKLFEEDMTSKAVSVLKSYKGEVKGLEDYIKYLMNTSDDISSSIQAVADDMDRDNDAEDSLRRDLEKLSLAEGRINEEDLENGLDNKIWDFRHLIKNFDPLDIKVGDTVITPTEGENIIDKIVKYGWDYNYGDIINFQFGNRSLSNKDLIQRNNRRK
jgi:hypothetical protein